MEPLLILSIFVSFFISFIFLPMWIDKCRSIGLMWKDMNKKTPRKAASSGGVVVVLSFVLGVLFYIAVRTFVFKDGEISIKIFAVLSVILLLAIVGLVDDLLGWKHGGLSSRIRIILSFMAAVPLVVINAGVHNMNFPFLGTIDFGLFYPLFLIPLGIAGATTTFNMLAGFNGLEAGQGVLILGFLSFIAYKTGNPWLSIISLCMVASLIVFYFFNKYPAEVFPGDVLTYSVGGLIASLAILGNFEKIAFFAFLPYVFEVILKLRGGLKIQSFAKVNEDGTLSLPENKVYSLTHLSIFILKKFKKKVYEKDVVRFIFFIQIIFIVFAYIAFIHSYTFT